MVASLFTTSASQTSFASVISASSALRPEAVGDFVGAAVVVVGAGVGLVVGAGSGLGLGAPSGTHAAPSPRSQQSFEPHGATRSLPVLT